MGVPTIDVAFISQFEAEVHQEYQRRNTYLRPTVRNKTVNAEDDTFQKTGSVALGTKARNGLIPISNTEHTNVKVTMADTYGGEYVDKLDLLKTNIDERGVVVGNLSAAAARKTDSTITTAMSAATNVIVHGSVGMTKAKVNQVFVAFGDGEVPEMDRYWPVSHAGWNDLQDINEFSNMDYVGADQLVWTNGATSKAWQSFRFFTFSGLPKASTTRTTFAYHKNAVGYGLNAEPSVTPSWENDRQAWLFAISMSDGGVIIDNNGIYAVETTE